MGDIYVVTNYKQGNVTSSAPIPAGPENTHKSYTPLWQASMVTWKTGTTTPHTLKSEEEVLAAARGFRDDNDDQYRRELPGRVYAGRRTVAHG